MIDLRQYFFKTYHKHKYYLNKFTSLLTYDDMGGEWWIYDEQEAIEKFKNLIQPYNSTNPIEEAENEHEFIYLCNYLNDIGYYIEEFPKFLERPTNRWDLSYNLIRQKIIKKEGYNGKVTWESRRMFVEKLNFKRKQNYKLSEDLSKSLKAISTRNADFDAMELDEKLETICNCIEFLLKPNKNAKKYLELDYSDTEGFLSDEVVKAFRNTLECFRHSTEDDIAKRSEYSKIQKEFFIAYGLVILDYIKIKLKK